MDKGGERQKFRYNKSLMRKSESFVSPCIMMSFQRLSKLLRVLPIKFADTFSLAPFCHRIVQSV